MATFVYVDFTNDHQPFYVGMGDQVRIRRQFGRNKHHTNTAHKHGLNRVIVATFEKREDAVDKEIELIAEHHTFVDDHNYNGIGCNYTKGGEGCACSVETRQKISRSRSGQPAWNKGRRDLTSNITEEQRQKAREQIIAFNMTAPFTGKHHTEATRAKMRKPHRCSICGKTGHIKRTCQKSPGFT